MGSVHHHPIRIPGFQLGTILNHHIFGNGRIDIVVTTADVYTNSPCLKYTEEIWAWYNRVNYDGVMWTARIAGKIFKS